MCSLCSASYSFMPVEADVRFAEFGKKVCNMLFSKNSNELVTTHGFSAGQAQNQVVIWRYPSMQQVAQLAGHTFRVSWLFFFRRHAARKIPDACLLFSLPIGPLSRLLARRTDDRHGRRRRDPAVLERVPEKQDGAQDRVVRPEPVREHPLNGAARACSHPSPSIPSCFYYCYRIHLPAFARLPLCFTRPHLCE
jgi:hypothetical protein